MNQVDWQQLQQEYRDTIDFRKMLQLVPGIGAIVGLGRTLVCWRSSAWQE